MKQRNGESGWVSASSDTLAPYCVDIVIIYDPPCPGVADETIVLSQFHRVELDHSLRDGTVALKGSCNITEATATRS